MRGGNHRSLYTCIKVSVHISLKTKEVLSASAVTVPLCSAYRKLYYELMSDLPQLLCQVRPARDTKGYTL